jgi:hypothetical protein
MSNVSCRLQGNVAQIDLMVDCAAPTMKRTICLAAIALLVGCAASGQNAFVDDSTPEAGLVEIANASPNYPLTVAVFDDSEECRGMKYVAEVEKFDEKSFRARHRKTLTLWIAYTAVQRGGGKGCGGIYSLPFERGDLRVVSEAPRALRECLVRAGWSEDRKTWAAVPSVRKRIGRTTVLGDEPRCEKE